MSRMALDEDAERAVMGCILLAPGLLGKLVSATGLRATDFARPLFAKAFAVMLTMDDDGRPIDAVTVGAECAKRWPNDPRDDWTTSLEAAYHGVPMLAHAERYAERVVECSRLRDYATHGYALIEAAGNEDWTAIKAIEGELLTGTPSIHTYEPDDVADLVMDYLGGEHEVFPTPWPKLNALISGGFRRGALTLISGYTSMGKSIMLDQILEHAARESSQRVHLYINEMTPTERALRIVARLANVRFGQLQTDQLDLEGCRRLMAQLGEIPFGITDCAGWTAQDIARDIRSRKWDIAGIDIFHKIPGGNLTTELDEKSRLLNEIPKASQANCHVLLCAHVSKPYERDGRLRPPNGSNLRGTGSLENDADNLLFIHRDLDERTGRKLPTGVAYFTKVRNGTPGSTPLVLDAEHMRFGEPVRRPAANAIEPEMEF